MATVTKRNVKRNANKKAAKNAKSNRPAGPIVVAEKGKARNPTDFAKGRAAKAVDRGIAANEAGAKGALAAARAIVHACANGEMLTSEGEQYLEAVRDETIARRMRAKSMSHAEAAKSVGPVDKNRASQINSIAKLHTWKCCDDLFEKLADFDDISERTIVVVSRAIRGKKGDEGWNRKRVEAPSRNWLANIVSERTTREPTPAQIRKRKAKAAARAKKTGGVVGYPSIDANAGLAASLASLVAFDKCHGKDLSKSDRAQVTGAIASMKAIKSAVKALATKRIADAAADE